MDKKYSDKIELDKFYTKESVAIECLKNINIGEYDAVIEPSAGSGAFFNNIEHKNKIGLDLMPESDLIQKQDWFKYEINKNLKDVLVVGNPPFGKRNKLSSEFIKHACSFDNVKTIAFILPNVYNKHTLQKHFGKAFRLKEVVELGDNAFEVDGEEYHVPCSFYIFDKSEGDCLRFRSEEWTESSDWTFGDCNDYSFYVMGAAPKRLKMKPHKNNRGYYIKVKEGISISGVRRKFRHNLWNGNSSANGGVAWITKPELVYQYEKWEQDPKGAPRRRKKK